MTDIDMEIDRSPAPSHRGAWITTGPFAQIVPLVVLAVIGVAVPIALAHAYGALGIPRSDSWSYLRTLFVWHRTGHWNFNDWVSMTLVGQVVLAVPILAAFGYSVTAVNIAFALFGFVGLVALFGLGQIAGLSPWKSALVTLCIAACPLWGPLAPTFMTDVPAFVFETVALALACFALRGEQPSMKVLTASIVAGVIGISIRQYAAIPVVSILLTAGFVFVRAGDRRRLRGVILLAAVVCTATVAVLAWWHSVPGGKALAVALPSVSSLTRTYNESAGFLRLAGVVLLPVLLYIRPVALVRRALTYDRRVAITTLLVGTFWTITGLVPDRPLVGNYFDARGVLADNLNLPGVRPRIMPALAFDAIAVVGGVGMLLLLLAAVPWLADRVADIRARRLPAIEPIGLVLGLTIGVSIVAYGLAIATDEPIFDRYALPTLPIVGIVLLRSAATRTAVPPVAGAAPPPRTLFRNGLAATVALVVLALLGAAYTAESASFDGTRWHLAEKVVAAGYAPEQIAAGDEWVGWYRGLGPPTAGTIGGRRKSNPAYYEGLCVSILIDAHQLPGRVIASSLSHAPTRKPSLFVAYRNDEPCATTRSGTGP